MSGNFHPRFVMAALEAAIHLARLARQDDSSSLANARVMDGRVRPGHDEEVAS